MLHGRAALPSASDTACPSASDMVGVVETPDTRWGFGSTPLFIADARRRRLRRSMKSAAITARRSSTPRATPTPMPILALELSSDPVLPSEPVKLPPVSLGEVEPPVVPEPEPEPVPLGKKELEPGCADESVLDVTRLPVPVPLGREVGGTV
jgi:hypothetical protein